MRSRDALIGSLLLWGSVEAAPPHNLAAGAGDARRAGSETAARRLTGKFLHITDFHPDPFYKTYSSTTAEAACHRQHGPAGVYGAETSACDSPFSLINQTFQWISDNIKDDIDFVIWTGDSARHDNDEDLPRTQKQVIQQNEFLVSKFSEVFGAHGHKRPGNDLAIPVVPTFGNNDIMPHNIFLGGPNRWTIKYLDIWRSFIPEAQRHQFQQGGWFSVEVIPGQLAVISLNTIYFFSSNSGVDGCASKHEPGYEHMEWLRIQLQFMRDRGIKVILMGHVPPARVDSKESWDETCWQKYTLFVRQFRDIIVGSLYGHMNIDHFMLQDFEQISKEAEKGRMASGASASTSDEEHSFLEDGEVTAASASDYLINLRQAWARLPAPPSSKKSKPKSTDVSVWEWMVSQFSTFKKDGKNKKGDKKDYLDKIGGKYAERYAATLVAPSVVPNYFPTLRIIEYNISGLESLHVSPNHVTPPPYNSHPGQSPLHNTQFSDDESYAKYVDDILAQKKKHRGKKHKKGPRKYKFRVPDGPSKSAPPGPAYSPQSLTWTRYVQYFANLTHINNDFLDATAPTSESDASSPNDQTPHTIFGLNVTSTGDLERSRWKEGKHGKHQGKRPRPEPHPNEFTFEVEYDTAKDRGFKDLTVRRWVEYARKIGRKGRKGGKGLSVDGEEEEDEFASVEDQDEEDFEDSDSDDDEEEEADIEDDEDAEDASTSGKKKHKKHKKKKHHISKEWFTFVKRAFVGTMNPDDIQELFGTKASMVHDADAEIVEL